MGAKRVLATIDSLAQFDEHVEAGRPRILNLPLQGGGRADLMAGRRMSEVLTERGVQSKDYIDLYDLLESDGESMRADAQAA